MEIKINEFIGDYDWEELRAFLVVHLISCDSEKEFLKILGGLVMSVGTPEDLKKTRKKLGLKKFTKEDMEKIKKWK